MPDETERIRILLEAQTQAADRAMRKSAREIVNLERRYDPLSRAQVEFQRATERLARGLDNGTLSVERHSQLLRLAQAEYDNTTRAINDANRVIARQSQAVGGLNGFLNRHKTFMQQAGFQVQDFAVQVAGGTNAMTALSQQGSQLLGVVGRWGPLFGAVLAVAAPLTAVLLSQAEAAEDLDSALKLVAETADSLNGIIDVLTMSTQELTEKYGEAAPRVREFARLMAEIAVADAREALGAQIGILDDVISGYTQAQKAGADFRNAIFRIREEFNLGDKAAREFNDALLAYESADGFEAQRQALVEVLDLLRRQGVELETLPTEFRAALSASLEYSNAVDAAANIANRLADEVSGVAEETRRATEAADNLALAFAGVNRARALGLTTPTEDAVEGLDGFALPGGPPRGSSSKGRSRKSGSRGTLSKEEAALQREVAQIVRETRTEAEQYAEELARLNVLRDQGAISEEVHARAVENLEQSFRDVDQMASQVNSTLSSAFVGLTNQTRSFDDALRGVVNTLSSMVLNRAFDRIFTPAIDQLFAATGGGGAGGGGGGLFGGFLAGGGRARAGSSYIVGEQGPELFTPDSAGVVTPNHALSSMAQQMRLLVELSPDLIARERHQNALTSGQIALQVASASQAEASARFGGRAGEFERRGT